ncbi:hypothetical protein WME91_08355 [Sorangium sp. So ce269]
MKLAKTGSTKQPTAKAKSLQGRRFTDDQRKQALTSIAGGMERVRVAKAIGS